MVCLSKQILIKKICLQVLDIGVYSNLEIYKEQAEQILLLHIALTNLLEFHAKSMFMVTCPYDILSFHFTSFLVPPKFL